MTEQPASIAVNNQELSLDTGAAVEGARTVSSGGPSVILPSSPKKLDPAEATPTDRIVPAGPLSTSVFSLPGTDDGAVSRLISSAATVGTETDGPRPPVQSVHAGLLGARRCARRKALY